MSLLYPFDFPCQLKKWHRVQGVALRVLLFWATGYLFVAPESQPQDCLESSESSSS